MQLCLSESNMNNEQIGEFVSIMIRIPILCFTLKKKSDRKDHCPLATKICFQSSPPGDTSVGLVRK